MEPKRELVYKVTKFIGTHTRYGTHLKRASESWFILFCSIKKIPSRPGGGHGKPYTSCTFASRQGNLTRTPDVAVVIPLNNPGGPEGDTVTVDEQLLNTEYPPDPH